MLLTLLKQVMLGEASLTTMTVLSAFAIYVTTSLYLLFNPRILHRKRTDENKRRFQRYAHISHRGGAAESYENTIGGFRHAIKDCGTQMLEMDVRRTKDGVVVVSHDMHLGRLCGQDARVDELNYAELPKYKQQVPIEFEPGHFFEDQKNNDRQIPTLEGVFRAFPDVGINIDIKSCDMRLVEAVDDLIRKYSREDRTAWGSFSHETSMMCMEANSKTGLLFSFRRVLTVLAMFYAGLLPFVDVPETHFEIPVYRMESSKGLKLTQRLRIAFENMSAMMLNAILSHSWLFHHLRARGIGVYVWVLNSEAEYEKAFRSGVSGVMTDYPAKLRSFLDANPALHTCADEQ